MLTWEIKQLTTPHWPSHFQLRQVQPGPGKLKFLKFLATVQAGNIGKSTKNRSCFCLSNSFKFCCDCNFNMIQKTMYLKLIINSKLSKKPEL